MNPDQPERGKTLAVTGAILQLGPVVGAIITSILIIHAFGVLAQANVSDPRELAGKVGEVLIFVLAGFAFGLIGLVLIFVAVLGAGYRSSWIYWVLLADGVIYQVAFPIGSIVGVCILIYCFTHRAEFLNPKAPAI